MRASGSSSTPRAHSAGYGLYRHPRSGFTLVEILIVIAIIAIVAAVALPMMNSARERGRQVSCASRMQQLGLAFQQYVQEHGRYPGAGDFQDWWRGGHWVAGLRDDICANSGPPQPSGCLAYLASPYGPTGRFANVEQGAIYEYVRKPEMYYCPSNEDGDTKHLSYSMNCAIAGLRANLIQQPQEIILLIDEDKANDGYLYATDNTVSGAAGNSTDALTTVHNGGGNLLFVDGHVRFYNPASFKLDVSPEGQQNKYWWPDNPSFPTRHAYTPSLVRPQGWPHFHDAAFGPKGANPIVFGDNGSQKKDACQAPVP